ncbi:MAG: sulfite exporter TauE/SafE family protein [Bacteroidota bacterium]
MSLPSFLLLFAGGCLAGTLGTVLGIGGGLFLIPFLVLVVGIPMHQAIATSIIAVIATSSTGASIFLERGVVNVRLGVLLEVATVIGAIAGGLTANLLSGALLTKFFATILLVTALLMIPRMRNNRVREQSRSDGALSASFTDDASGENVRYTVNRIPGTMAISLLAGNISGLLGIGGGIFKVPAMHLLSGVPIKVAAATSNFMIGVTAAASAFIYFSHGHLNPALASSATLGVLGGSIVGTQISKRINSRALVRVFVLVLLLLSAQMYLR